MNKWLLSTNHKVIGTMNFIFEIWSGMIVMLKIRIELAQPGTLLNNNQTYNVIITSHAFMKCVFTVMTIMIGGFGNWLFSLMIGAPFMTFLRMNDMSFWLLPQSMALLTSSFLIEMGSVKGWTIYHLYHLM